MCLSFSSNYHFLNLENAEAAEHFKSSDEFLPSDLAQDLDTTTSLTHEWATAIVKYPDAVVDSSIGNGKITRDVHSEHDAQTRLPDFSKIAWLW
jgi:hypothetical protein